jgi:hypothetical protein
MQSNLSAAGIPTEYGGKGANGLIEIAFATFLDGSYLELIGAQKTTGAAAHYFGKFIDANAGPCAWGLFIPDAHRPDDDGWRSGDLNWEPANHENPQKQGTLFPYAIEDAAFQHRKPSAPRFAGVAFVVLGVRNLDAAIDLYRKRFHYSAPQRSEDSNLQMRLAAFNGTPIVLAAPLNPSAPLAKHIAQFDEGPYAVVLDQANHPSAGFIGQSSQWFGQPIVWMSVLGPITHGSASAARSAATSSTNPGHQGKDQVCHPRATRSSAPQNPVAIPRRTRPRVPCSRPREHLPSPRSQTAVDQHAATFGAHTRRSEGRAAPKREVWKVKLRPEQIEAKPASMRPTF